MVGTQEAGWREAWHVFEGVGKSQFMQDHADHVRNGVYLKSNAKKLQ